MSMVSTQVISPTCSGPSVFVVVVVNFSSNLLNLQSTSAAMPMVMLPIRHLVMPLKTNQENSEMAKRREEVSAHNMSCQLPRILHSGMHLG